MVLVQTAPLPALRGDDTVWLLIATALVLLMTPALGFFYGGLVRRKNVLNTIMMSLVSLGAVGLAGALLGYSLAFTPGSRWLGDLGHAFLRAVDLQTGSWGAFPQLLFFAYQGAFAIITAALISGAVVERMRFGAYLLFITLWSLVVYAPVAHWVWGGGFLMKAGILDFAGGTVVHINAGVAGLVCALVLGKRIGLGTESFAPHNLVLTVIGASLLWVGWFGFNAGSAVASNGSAGMAMAVTQIATATAALAWMFVEWALRGKPSALGIASGAVAGLVAITPCAGFVGGMAPIWIGFVAGALFTALGVLFMIPLRRALIVKEHGTLPYPEGTACAQVLVAGERGGPMARLVFRGLGIAFPYKVLISGLGLLKDVPR